MSPAAALTPLLPVCESRSDTQTLRSKANAHYVSHPLQRAREAAKLHRPGCPPAPRPSSTRSGCGTRCGTPDPRRGTASSPRGRAGRSSRPTSPPRTASAGSTCRRSTRRSQPRARRWLRPDATRVPQRLAPRRLRRGRCSWQAAVPETGSGSCLMLSTVEFAPTPPAVARGSGSGEVSHGRMTVSPVPLRPGLSASARVRCPWDLPRFAWVEGHEPPTAGFGDRSSTN